MSTAIGSGTADRISLASVVRRGLQIMRDIRTPHADVVSGELERALRVEIERSVKRPRTPGVPDPGHAGIAAARTACAYLATRAHGEAYLALLAAHDHLLAPTAGAGAGEVPEGRARAGRG